jgi:hypothetical protein
VPVYGVTLLASTAWAGLVALGGSKTSPRPRTRKDAVYMLLTCGFFSSMFYIWSCAMLYPLLF